MELKICHLYPDALNVYGDGGNITCLKQRLLWRGIDVSVDGCCIGDRLDATAYDLFVIGGGQSPEQGLLIEDLRTNKSDQIKAAIADGKTFLAICSGFEMMGHYYENPNGVRTELIGAVDMHTIAQKDRFIGDYAFSCDSLHRDSVVAFENHAGQTWLGQGVAPLGRIITGHGNNGQDGTEGARVNNFFGSYGHGCLLPKNPALADLLLQTALERKYGCATLSPLDDRIEYCAHDFIATRILPKR